MANNQANITQAISKAAVQAMAVATSESSPGIRSETVSTGSKLGVFTLKQPTFDLEQQLNTWNSKKSVINKILKSCYANDKKKYQLSGDLLGRQGLKFIETPSKTE